MGGDLIGVDDHRVAVADVEDLRVRGTPALLGELSGACEALLVDVGQGEPGSAGGELNRERAPDARPRAGDGGDLAGDGSHAASAGSSMAALALPAAKNRISPSSTSPRRR